MSEKYQVSEDCADPRVVEHAKIVQACEVLGLPAPKSDSDIIKIDIRPFWDGGPATSAIRMNEYRTRLSYVPLPSTTDQNPPKE